MTIGPKRYESRPVVSKLPHKRKFQDVNGDSSMGKKSKSGEPVSRQLVCGYPSDHPFNKVRMCIQPKVVTGNVFHMMFSVLFWQEYVCLCV